MAPMLAEDVHRVDLSRHVKENQDLACNCLAHVVERKHGVPLVQLSIRLGGTINNGFVVSKHVSGLCDWDSKVAQGVAKIHDLFHACSCSDCL